MSTVGEAIFDDTIESPNPGELDVLIVLWEEMRAGGRPLKLSDVHKRIRERRQLNYEPEPALTTVSTHLRGLLRKRLAREITVTGSGKNVPKIRSLLTPPTRSPLTGYVAVWSPELVLRNTFRALGAIYPPAERASASVHFVQALDWTDDSGQVDGKLDAIIAIAECFRLPAQSIAALRHVFAK